MMLAGLTGGFSLDIIPFFRDFFSSRLTCKYSTGLSGKVRQLNPILLATYHAEFAPPDGWAVYGGKANPLAITAFIN
jgi:hypothetical protein